MGACRWPKVRKGSSERQEYEAEAQESSVITGLASRCRTSCQFMWGSEDIGAVLVGHAPEMEPMLNTLVVGGWAMKNLWRCEVKNHLEALRPRQKMTSINLIEKNLRGIHSSASTSS